LGENGVSGRDRLRAVIVVAVGLAITVGIWLLGILLAGGIDL
jgi:hypothetical protein